MSEKSRGLPLSFFKSTKMLSPIYVAPHERASVAIGVWIMPVMPEIGDNLPPYWFNNQTGAWFESNQRQLFNEGLRCIRFARPMTADEIDTHERDIGIYDKYDVRRRDRKHPPKTPYFVLSPTTDPYALEALAVYAKACSVSHPKLAEDIHGLIETGRTKQGLGGHDPHSV